MTLETFSIAFLVASALSFLAIAMHVARHKQKMAIMNVVWPITALYFGPFALWMYFVFGKPKEQGDRPFWQKVWVGVTHCGAGCTLADFAAEWIVFLTGFTLLGSRLWGGYLCDFALAYLVGIVF